VTSAGDPVLGDQGEIVLDSAAPTIDGTGKISVNGKTVAQLRIVKISDKSALTRLGKGMYSAAATSVQEDPLGVRVRQGYLETSNVSVTDEMVHMIETVRHFESCQRVLKGYDAMLDRAINTIGEF